MNIDKHIALWAKICEGQETDSTDLTILCEMATVGYPTIENKLYKIVIRGPANRDREQPHVHIYLKSDIPSGRTFNFEVSLLDILSKNEVNLVTQFDITRNNRQIDITNREQCSWDGYTDLKDGFINFINSAPTGKFKRNNPNVMTNLELIINKWNEESNEMTDNPLADYIRTQGIEVLDQYKKYFPELYGDKSTK